MARNESVNLPRAFKEFRTNEDNHISKISLKEYAKPISHQNNLRSHMPKVEEPDSPVNEDRPEKSAEISKPLLQEWIPTIA